MNSRLAGVILAAVFFILPAGCDKERGNDVVYEEARADLPQIKERGHLIAITTYSATSYFLYRGQPLGYDYELLQRLGDYLDLEVEIKIARNLDSLISMLREGQGDLIAHGMTITSERRQKVAFCEYHTTTRQVLVQRKPENWRQMKLHEIEEKLIRNPLDLIGKKVHVRRNSSYYERLKNLSEEIGGNINIVPVAGELETEDLIGMVADGEIDYTVADRNIALINATYYPDLDVETVIGFPQQIAWAVRKSSPELLKAINGWIRKMKKDTDYYVIYNKYFKNRKAFKRRVDSEFYSKTGGKISRFDDIIREQAAEIGWDWRLLASMIYQESQFETDARSWVGASGLMQIMPATAEQFGDYDLSDPEQSIRAGVAFIKYLQSRYEDIPDTLQRIKFVMASYNVGENHIADARRLAEKYGRNPDIWDDNVERYIRLKSKAKYYNDEVVKHGYCRGREPYEYVRDIFERYRHYRRFIPLDATASN